MINEHGGHTLLHHILNIEKNEISRVVYCFLIKFLYRFGFAIGWTVIVALVVSNFGIKFLPYIFIFNGLLIIASGNLYSRLITKFQNSRLIIATVSAAVFVIVMATLFLTKLALVQFLMLVFVESFLLYQLNTLLAPYIEKFFSPLSSQRTFPIIESADTIAMLLAGILIAKVSGVMNPLYFFYIWAFVVLMIIPLIIVINKRFKGKYDESVLNPQKKSWSLMLMLTENIKRARSNPFILSFIFVVLCQWVFISLMEFQYTKAISESVSGNILIPNSLGSYEHALIHALGSLQILFGGSALLIQLFVGSRIITSLGIISSILIYPILGFLSVIGLTSNFSYMTGLLAKNNTEMGNVLFKDVYYSTFYALPEKYRELSREFLEEFVRPFSSIIGMTLIVAIQYFFTGPTLILITNVTLFVAALIMFIYAMMARREYTEMVASVLFNPKSTEEDKLHSLEILAQNGHGSRFILFSKALYDNSLSDGVKLKIIETFGEAHKTKYIPLLVKMSGCPNRTIGKAARLALSKYAIGDELANLLLKDDQVISEEIYKKITEK